MKELEIKIRNTSYKIDLVNGGVWEFVFEPKSGPDAGTDEGWECVGEIIPKKETKEKK